MYANNKQELAKKRDLLDKEIYYSEGKGVLINDRINGLKSRLNPELNKKAIDLFLSLRYVPAPYTIYKGIKKLPVFHSLILEQLFLHETKSYTALHFLLRNDSLNTLVDSLQLCLLKIHIDMNPSFHFQVMLHYFRNTRID